MFSCIPSGAASPVTPLTVSADSMERIDSIDSMDCMDSIEAIESSRRLGRGRGRTSPFSTLLITSPALFSAPRARASRLPRTCLSARRISPSILFSAYLWRRSCSRMLMVPPGRAWFPSAVYPQTALDELLVHPDVRGVTDAQGLLELVQGGAAPEEPDREGVAEDHRRDAPHTDLLAALPDGVLERLGGRDGPRGAAHYELRGLVVAHPQVAPDGPDRRFGKAERTRGEVGARSAKLYLGGLEVDVALEEAPDLADRHPGVEHEPYDGGVAGGVAVHYGEGEELLGLVVLEEGDALVERLVHRLYWVEVQLGVGARPHPVEEAPHGGVLAVDGEALAVLAEQAVAELHHAADAHVLDLRDALLGEKARELLEVRRVELGGARAGVRVVGEVCGELFDQAVDVHEVILKASGYRFQATGESAADTGDKTRNLERHLRSRWRSIASWAALISAVIRSALARLSGSENRSGW